MNTLVIKPSFFKRLKLKIFNSIFVSEKNEIMDANEKRLEEFKKRTEGYSQEGEDLVLHRLFKNQDKGVYVDVGAHHPFRFSNTYRLHKRGWSGLNIDIVPDVIEKFNVERPGDINLNIGVSDTVAKKDVFVFKERALTTIHEDIAKNILGNTSYDIDFVLKDVQLMPLNDILMKYNINKIDFLNIDAEGEDFKIVSSLNWLIYSPAVVCVESRGGSLEDFKENEVWKVLHSNNYVLFSKLYNSWIFIRKNSNLSGLN